jgi:glutamyl-tRNA reductase
VREVEEWLSRSSGVPLKELRPYLFLLRDRDATHHLLRVSGGLDSLVMGEGQILAQVRQVYKVGQNSTGFGRQLNGLFKQAITAGKRVRSETSISTGSVSVSSAAVELAQLKLPSHSWADARVCIIGAGKMSTLLVKHLLSKGCTSVTILNRSLPRAHALQEEFPDMAMDIRLMPDLMACVQDSDVIFAASGALCGAVCFFWGAGEVFVGAGGVAGSSRGDQQQACAQQQARQRCACSALCAPHARAGACRRGAADTLPLPRTAHTRAHTPTSTGSEELLIHAEDVVSMPRRSDAVGGVRRFIDISVPRNIAPGINAEQHGAIVYNVDDLKEVVVANKEARAAAAAEAEVLLR